MCHFVTVILPTDNPTGEFVEIAKRRGFRFNPQPNPSIAAQLNPGEKHFGRGGCDCGTSIGAGRMADEQRPSIEKQIAKLRKKGWGNSKIEKWVAQQESNRRDLARKGKGHETTPTGEAWLGFITEALSSGSIDSVGILLHWYAGSLEDEEIRLLRREEVPLAALDSEYLVGMNEDVLYEFSRWGQS